jgi:hypothetical protein
VRAEKSQKQLDEDEKKAMERGEYDRVPLGVNLRPSADLFRLPETPFEQGARHLLETKIRYGQIQNEVELRKNFDEAFPIAQNDEEQKRLDILFNDLLRYLKIYRQPAVRETDKQFKERLDLERKDMAERMNKQRRVGAEFTLFMY